MRLLRLEAEGVRGVPDGRYLFNPDGYTLVTGAAASGKSRLLGAIAALKEGAGAYGAPPSAKEVLRDEAASGLLAGTFRLNPTERERCRLDGWEVEVRWDLGNQPGPEVPAAVRRLLAFYEVGDRVGRFEHFPACRGGFEDPRELPSRPPVDPSDMTDRLGSGPRKYGWVRRFFADRVAADARALRAHLGERGIALRSDLPSSLYGFDRALDTLAPGLRFLEVEPTERSPLVFFGRKGGGRVELGQLSASEQHAIVFAAVSKHLALSHSVLLIDTPEAGIHPEHHATFFDGLLDLGTDNQVIAATSSAPLLRRAPAAAVIDLGRGGR